MHHGINVDSSHHGINGNSLRHEENSGRLLHGITDEYEQTRILAILLSFGILFILILGWKEDYLSHEENIGLHLGKGIKVVFTKVWMWTFLAIRQVSASIYQETNLDPHHHGMAITLPTMIIYRILSRRTVLAPGEYWIRNAKWIYCLNMIIL